ncbi:hypothetical protein [Lactococcus garvieae]|uniref:hypothetical protein n=1 Tax=Lactococcus garvieae TaxID=1363 RepID=UPI00254E76C6|nr:hypothetical protein [Lactococcus garvieae]
MISKIKQTKDRFRAFNTLKTDISTSEKHLTTIENMLKSVEGDDNKNKILVVNSQLNEYLRENSENLQILDLYTEYTKVTEELKRSSRLETEEHISEEKNKLQKNISSKEELLIEYQEFFKNEVQEPPLIKNERRELRQLKAELDDVSHKHQDCKSFYSQYDKIINHIIAYIYSIRENNL